MFRVDRKPSVSDNIKAPQNFSMQHKVVVPGLNDTSSNFDRGEKTPSTPNGVFSVSKTGSSKYNVYN